MDHLADDFFSSDEEQLPFDNLAAGEQSFRKIATA